MKVKKKVEADGTFTYSMSFGVFTMEQTFLYEQDEEELTRVWRKELRKYNEEKERQERKRGKELWADSIKKEQDST